LVQLGNFHVGKGETAKRPTADVMEVGALWDALMERYDTIQFTQILQNFAHDQDLKLVLAKGLTNTLEKQVNKIEEEMNVLQIPLPERPPKSVNVPSTTGVFEDELIFGLVFAGIQHMLARHVEHIRAMTTRDGLRKMFIEFLRAELSIFDKMVLYGKTKGWLKSPPKFVP